MFQAEGEEVEGDNSNRDNNSYRDRDRNDLQRVYSDQRPILNPAELADMEVLLGSKAGTYVLTYILSSLLLLSCFTF